MRKLLNRIQIALIFLFLPGLLLGQLTIRGQVYELATDAVLPHAAILVTADSKEWHTEADANGYYSLTISEGQDTLEICYFFVGHKDTCTTVIPGNIIQGSSTVAIDAFLKADPLLDEVIVRDLSKKRLLRSSLEKITLNPRDIKSMPNVAGEADVIKTLQMLPQVQGGFQGSAGLYVRGSSMGQNMILIDEVPLFNLTHLYGFFSVIPTAAVNRVDFYPGVIPSKYTGRLSSAVDVSISSGHRSEYHGEATIGLALSQLQFEGPVKKDKSSFLLSLRRSYMDIFAELISDETGIANSSMGDVLLKYNHQVDANNTFSILFFRNIDRVKGSSYSTTENRSTDEDNWGNIVGSLRWFHIVNDKLTFDNTSYFSGYNYQIFSNQNFQVQTPDGFESIEANLNLRHFVGELSNRLSFSFLPTAGHDINFGFKIGSYINSHPQLSISPKGLDSYEISGGNQENYPLASIFGSHKWDFGKHWMLSSGVHISSFFNDAYKPLDIQPRLHLTYTLQKFGLNFRAGYGRNVQYMHNSQVSNLLLPADSWFPSNERFPAEKANQFNLGFTKRLPWNLKLDVDSYYKSLQNVVDNQKTPTGSRLENLIALNGFHRGRGSAYGLELMLRRKAARSSGWIAYSYGRSLRQISELNQGEPYPFTFNRLHSVKVYFSHKFSKSLELTANWTFGTGYPVSIPVQSYNSPDVEVSPEYYQGLFNQTSVLYHIPEKNNVRYPDSHQLNAGINWYSENDNFQHIFRFMIYNVYSRLNVISMRYNPSDNSLSAITSFPILPFLSYTIIYK